MSNSVGGTDPVEGNISKKRSRKRSEVWDHFKETSDGKRAICKYCDGSMCAESTNGTSHLKRHLKSCLKQQQEVDQPLIMGIPNEVRKIGSTIEKDLDLQVKIAILAEIPFAHSECKKAVSSLMGIMDMDKTIFSYYELKKEKLANQFQYLTSRVCFSVEINRVAKRLFCMSITAHFIDEDFNLVKILIGYKLYPDTLEECEVQIIEKCISDWKFGDKKFSITENGFVSFDSSRGREEFSPTMLSEDLYSHLLSYKQKLANSYSQAVGPVLSEEVANIKNFIEAMKAVCCQMDSFNQISKERDLSPINEDWLNDLNHYDSTWMDFDSENLEYWEPVIKIFKEAIHYKDVFSQYAEINYGTLAKGNEGCLELELEVLDCNGLDTANLSSLCTGKELSTSSMCDIDWERVETAIKIFDKVHEITDRMDSIKYPTSNLYFLNLEEFENMITTNENINVTQHNHLYYEMCDNLSYLTKNKVYFVACVLDPRYKLSFLRYYFGKPNRPQPGISLLENFFDKPNRRQPEYEEIPEFREKEDINEIWEILQTTFDAYVKGKTNEFANLQVEGCTSNSTHLSCPRDDGFSIYTKELEKNKKSELEKYLDDELVDRHDASFNLLGWWKQNSLRYPVLSRMARDFLAIPTCAYSVCNISSDFDVIEGFSPQLVEAVICSKDWILSDLLRVKELIDHGVAACCCRKYHGMEAAGGGGAWLKNRSNVC